MLSKAFIKKCISTRGETAQTKLDKLCLILGKVYQIDKFNLEYKPSIL